MSIQILEIGKLEYRNVGSCKHDRGCDTGTQGLHPTFHAETPSVPRFQPVEPEFWAWRTQIVADRLAESQKLHSEFSAQDMQTHISRHVRTATISAISGHRVGRTPCQFAPQNVSSHTHVYLVLKGLLRQ